MTTKEIKELLEKYLSLKGLAYGKSGDLEDLRKAEGYLNASLHAVELMMPLVEALNICASPYSSEHKEREAKEAIQTLVKTLKGE